MRYVILLLTPLILFCSCSSGGVSFEELYCTSPVPVMTSETSSSKSVDKYTALNYDKVRAIWISYIELAGIISSGEESFRTSFTQMCDNIASTGFNTVYVHVRAFGDAYYSSGSFPYARQFGEHPFDALSVMTDVAHEYKLSIHAWINPLRCETREGTDNMDDRYLIKKWADDQDTYDQYISYVEDTGHYWLDPAVSEVRELICEGVREIVSEYEVDGIHIDDYFYPTTEGWFDAGVYVESGTSLPLNKWRLNNINEMVSQMYQTVKSVNNSIQFGISPQGNIENNYSYLYADVRQWCSSKGYADYILPQIYYGYNDPVKPFDSTLDEWRDLCKGSDVKLVIGLAAYKTATEGEFGDTEGIISSQADKALSLADGMSVYSYKYLYNTERGLLEEQRLKRLFAKAEKES